MTANIYLRFPGGRGKAFTMSYDDGVEQDKRLIEIMRSNGLKGTFNVNSGMYTPEGTIFPQGQVHRRMTEADSTALYSDSGMEVAVHAYEHPFLEAMTPAECAYQIIKDREKLESQFGRIVRGMAYPFGTYNDSVIATLKNCGIAYCRTVISSHGFDLPADWLRLNATCHHNDPMLDELTERFLTQAPNRYPMMFYLWGHSFEFDDRNNWDLIERFAKKISGKEDVWYATNIEIYDYVKAYKQILVSVDGHIIYNPTSTDLFIEYNDFFNSHDTRIVELPAGKQTRV